MSHAKTLGGLTLWPLVIWRVDRLAEALLLPYLAWVSYATVLFALVRRNSGVLT